MCKFSLCGFLTWFNAKKGNVNFLHYRFQTNMFSQAITDHNCLSSHTYAIDTSHLSLYIMPLKTYFGQLWRM